MDRREFIKGTAWMGAVAAAAGCMTRGSGCGAESGGTMATYADKPFAKLRVGVIGLGRGYVACRCMPVIPGCEVSAVCDLNAARVKGALDMIAKNGQKTPPKVYTGGAEAWKGLCDDPNVDLVYNATPWELHVPIALYAMNAGKHVATEVPSAFTVDECWELVETSEKTKRHCMQLENCCYGEIEMLTFNLAKLGMLGELVHGEGAYIHDLRWMCAREHPGVECWRFDENRVHGGNRYPTHGLVPLCLTFDVNRGDRLDYLVSLESNQANFKAFMEANLAADNRRRLSKVRMADMNSTLIKTAKGKSLLIQHDVSTPRPYSRIQLVTGTKGSICDYPYRVVFEEKSGAGAHKWYDEKQAEEIRMKYRHPLWKTVGELAKRVGGHGGMDFIMDARWAYCLQQGLPLDMDVYDLAVTSCICELTETSADNRGRTCDIPDFTRGDWRFNKPLGIVDIDLEKMGVDKGKVGAAAGQITV